MKISAAEEYGVRCLMRLAVAWDEGRGTTIPEVARAEGLSPEYAAKLISGLRRAGLVRSERGVGGGVALARAPRTITLAEAFEGLSGQPLRTGNCQSAKGGECVRAEGCGLRGVWGALTAVVMDVLSQVTIEDLVDGEGVGTLPALLRAGGAWTAVEGRGA